jgi:parallel beta-helix repeat protein
MKLGTKICVGVALVAAILLVPAAIDTLHLPPTGAFESTISKGNHLAPHERIVVRDSSEFTIPGTGSGCECVRSGSGSSSDPFVISDWKINASGGHGISIAWTAAHFIVLNVYVNVTGIHEGAVLRNVANGTIQASSFSGGGILLYNSNAISILNNTITGGKFGILLEASDDNTISGNRLGRILEVGIFVRASHNLVDNNYITDGSYGGINIDGMTGFGSDNRIVNNIVKGNIQYGLGLWEAQNNSIRRNVLSENGVGIMLTSSCTKNLVEQNRVVNNAADGIFSDEQSTGNKIIGNTVTGNGNGVTSFDIHDESSDNLWLGNTFNTRRPDTIS